MLKQKLKLFGIGIISLCILFVVQIPSGIIINDIHGNRTQYKYSVLEYLIYKYDQLIKHYLNTEEGYIKEPQSLNLANDLLKPPFDKKLYWQTFPNYLGGNKYAQDEIISACLLGKYLLAHYYKEKYNAELFSAYSTLEIRRQILQLRKYKQNVKVGFIFTPYGLLHTTAVLYIKDHHGENIYISDPVEGYGSINFKKSQLNLLTNVNLYVSRINAKRQADSNSCVTNAIVYLKDSLQLTDFAALIKVVQATTLSHWFTYAEPEEMLKAVQIRSYLNKANVDIDKPISTAKGKTLSNKLQKHRRKVNLVDGGVQEIPAYLLDKGYRFAQIIEAEYNAYSNAELAQIFAERSGRDLTRFDINYQSKKLTLAQKHTEFLRAALLGHTYRTMQLYTQEVAQGAKSIDGEDALAMAVKSGHVGTFKALLRQGDLFDEKYAINLIHQKIQFLQNKQSKTQTEIFDLQRYQKMLSCIDKMRLLRKVDGQWSYIKYSVQNIFLLH